MLALCKLIISIACLHVYHITSKSDHFFWAPNIIFLFYLILFFCSVSANTGSIIDWCALLLLCQPAPLPFIFLEANWDWLIKIITKITKSHLLMLVSCRYVERRKHMLDDLVFFSENTTGLKYPNFLRKFNPDQHKCIWISQNQSQS